MKSHFAKCILFCSAFSQLLSCNKNNQKDFRCCTDEINGNVNNLEMSNGDITIFNIVTPNGDGINDIFFIENIDKYPNNRVEVKDLNKKIIYSTNNYGSSGNFFPKDNLEEGSYIYSIVIENEETFFLQGYLCLVKDSSEFSGGPGCRTSIPDPAIQ